MLHSLVRDPWLISLLLSRTLATAIFMTYAAALPVLLEAWDMSATAAGSISSGFQIGYAVSLVIFSWLADRLGARQVFLISAALSAASALAFGLFARDYASGLVLYTLVALTQGGMYTPAIMLIADRYPPERRGQAMGWLIASTSLGYALSLGLSGPAIGWGGYELAFVATGIGPLVGAVVAWLALSGTRNVVHRHAREAGFLTELRRNRPAVRLIAGYTFHSWELLGMWAWTPAFLAASIVVSGSAASEAAKIGAYISGAFHLIGLLASSTMGGLSDRLGRRTVLLALAAVSTACSFVFGWMVAWPIYLVALVGAIYAFAALGDSPVLSTAITEVTRPGHLGSTLALRAFLGFGAGAVAPVVFGMVIDATNPAAGPPTVWGWAYATLGLGGLVATLCAHGLQRGPRLRPPE